MQKHYYQSSTALVIPLEVLFNNEYLTLHTNTEKNLLSFIHFYHRTKYEPCTHLPKDIDTARWCVEFGLVLASSALDNDGHAVGNKTGCMIFHLKLLELHFSTTFRCIQPVTCKIGKALFQGTCITTLYVHMYKYILIYLIHK